MVRRWVCFGIATFQEYPIEPGSENTMRTLNYEQESTDVARIIGSPINTLDIAANLEIGISYHPTQKNTDMMKDKINGRT